MGIPQQVLDQEARANEIMKQVADESEQETAAGEVTDQQEDGDDQQGSGEDRIEYGDQTDLDEVEGLFEQDDRADDDTEASVWKHKYEVLKGKYDAEVPRLHEEIQRLTEERDLAPVAHQPADNGDAVAFLSKVRDEYGDEIADVFDAQHRQLELLKDQVSSVTRYQQHGAQDRFERTLEERVPGWRETNRDPRFLEWLTSRDQFSGVVRHNLLLDAAKRRDVERVTTFFNAYRRAKGGDGAGTSQKRKPSVSPGNSRASASGTAGKKQWTPESIARFYRDASIGRIKREDATRIEAEIMRQTGSRESG